MGMVFGIHSSFLFRVGKVAIEGDDRAIVELAEQTFLLFPCPVYAVVWCRRSIWWVVCVYVCPQSSRSCCSAFP